MKKWGILQRRAIEVAPAILGWMIIRDLPEGRIVGRITETEAYEENDPASHSYQGQTKRNASMFLGAGHAYVYFIYGNHFCLNIVTGPAGRGEAVLIRSLEIIEGEKLASRYRGYRTPLARGPGRLCQALGIERSFDGHNLRRPPLQLVASQAQGKITTSPRIGIRQAVDAPYRFILEN